MKMVTNPRPRGLLLLLAGLLLAAASPAPRPAAAAEDRFERMKVELQALVRKAPARAVSIWVEDRIHGRRYALAPDRVFRSASLIKIPVAALACRKWEREPAARTRALERRAWRILAESHNPSTDILVDHVGGLAKVNAFCREQGWAKTRMNSRMMDLRRNRAHNVTTPRDVAAMLRAIDDRTLVSERTSRWIWETLCQQKINQRIPAGLPKVPGLRVGNKTGTMLAVLHDAGIVRGPGVHYLLVIMTAGPASEPAGDLFCRKVSSAVYQALRPLP